jgi:hypothetical protein
LPGRVLLARAVGPVVGGLATLAFLPALDGGFLNWDDDENFLRNPAYRGLGRAELGWMFTTTLLGHWVPLSWLTLGLNHALGGMDPWGYHLGNLLVHGANTALLYLVALRLLAAAGTTTGAEVGRPGPGGAPATGPTGWPVVLGAAAAALGWGLHPLRVESVAWITERRDVLSGLFYLLAVWAYLAGARRDRPIGGRWMWLSAGALALGFASKAMVMTLPLTLLVLDAYPLRRTGLGWRRLVWEKLPHLAVAAAGALVALWAHASGVRIRDLAQYGIEARVGMVAYSFWIYPWRTLWPVGLSPLYELPEQVRLTEWRFLGPLLGVAALGVGLRLCRRRWPGALAAWAHVLIVVAPVSGVVHAGYHLAHDRYSYLAAPGLAVLGGGLLARALADRQRVSRLWAGVLVGVVGLALAALGALSWGQSQGWRDSESLWHLAVDAEPDCALCHANLGHALMGAGRWREAAAHLGRSARLRPGRAITHNNLAIALAELGRPQEARRELLAALAADPTLGGPLANLGILAAREGRDAEAAALLRGARALGALSPEGRLHLAGVEARLRPP